MIAVLKYGYSVAYDRLARMQKIRGVPVPASIQYELLESTSLLLNPVQQAMLREAAQASVIHTDDTRMKMLRIKRPADIVCLSPILSVSDHHHCQQVHQRLA